MKIYYELYATLMPYLPPGNSRHRRELEINPDTVPYDIIDQLKIPRKQAHLVILNGIFVTPDERQHTTFKDGDVLAIWPPVAGG